MSSLVLQCATGSVVAACSRCAARLGYYCRAMRALLPCTRRSLRAGQVHAPCIYCQSRGLGLQRAQGFEASPPPPVGATRVLVVCPRTGIANQIRVCFEAKYYQPSLHIMKSVQTPRAAGVLTPGCWQNRCLLLGESSRIRVVSADQRTVSPRRIHDCCC